MARGLVTRGRAFQGGAKRSVLWSGQDTVGTLGFGNAERTTAGVSILPNGFQTLEKLTITREVFDVFAGFRLADASTNVAVAYMGIIIVSLEAFGVGATAVPDPRIRQSDDWLFLGMWFLRAVSTGGGVPVNQANFIRRSFDLRGQRKTVPGEVLAAVVALDGLTGSTRTITFSCQYRNLVKLA